MASTDVVHDFYIFKIFADGHVEKLYVDEEVPPSNDILNTGVQAKDVIISHEVPARIYLPKVTSEDQKLSILLHIYGGGFACGSNFSSTYHTYVSALANETGALCISAKYRLIPENPVTSCYDDCWTALQWILSHAIGDGKETWINKHADFGRLFIVGESSGGNLAYNLTIQAGKSKMPIGARLIGTVLVDPYFSGSTDIVDKMWLHCCPNNKGINDPRITPDRLDLKHFPSKRVLVFVSENDEFKLRDRGYKFVEELKTSGWSGSVDIFESLGEEHCFHLVGDLFRPAAKKIMERLVSFIKDC